MARQRECELQLEAEHLAQTAPRPKGKATHTIITEYDLPRKLAMPHDVVVDPRARLVLRLRRTVHRPADPKTGEVTEFPIPELKKDFRRARSISNSTRNKTFGCP